MLHDIIHSLLVVTCHYTSGNIFFLPMERPEIERPWDDYNNDEHDDEE